MTLTPKDLHPMLVPASQERARLALQQTHHHDELLETKQASELRGIFTPTQVKRAASGEIPGRRIGRLWRFRDDLLRTGPASQPAG